MTITIDFLSLGIGFAVGFAVPCVVLFLAVSTGR
jgi:hypothetical protein